MDAFPQPGTLAVGPGAFGAFGASQTPNRPHLYVANLSPRVTEYMLQEIFAVAGNVQGVKIIPDRNFQHGGSNYGFVEYHDLRSAETALQTLNGRKIFDMEIRCNWAYQNQTAKEDLTNHAHLFVGDLSPEVTDEVLTKAFTAFGSLSDARVMWDMNSGKSRGYGFLAFRDRTDAEQAIATMNGEWLGSRAIRVNYANQKNQGGGGGAGGSGGGGGGGGGGTGGGMGGGGMGGAPPARPPMGGIGMGAGGPPMGGSPMRPPALTQPMGGPQGAPQGMGAPPPMGGGSGMTGGMAQVAPMERKSYGGPPPSYDIVVTQSPASNTTIYVGNLVPYTTQADLVPLFQGFGYIVEIRMQADRGFAFVKLDTHENAAMAIVNLQGAPVHGRQLKCSWGKDKLGGEGTTAAPVAASPSPVVQQQYQPQAATYAPQAYAAQGAAAGYGSPQAPLDPAAAAALAQWQAQYGAQYAAYMAQQAQLMQQQQQAQQ